MTLTDWPDIVRTDPLLRPDIGVRVYLPPLDVLARRWGEIEPLLHKATRRTGCFEPIDCLAMAFAAKAGIWLCMWQNAIDAVVVTQPVDYPRRRVLEVLFTGGDNMRRWIDPLRAAIDRHARDLGCSHVATAGRRGWVRAWGAKETGDVILVREV